MPRQTRANRILRRFRKVLPYIRSLVEVANSAQNFIHSVHTNDGEYLGNLNALEEAVNSFRSTSLNLTLDKLDYNGYDACDFLLALNLAIHNNKEVEFTSLFLEHMKDGKSVKQSINYSMDDLKLEPEGR